MQFDLFIHQNYADASLEYLACDLGASLQELVLDRCIHVTDVGIGHIAAMTSIQRLFLRYGLVRLVFDCLFACWFLFVRFFYFSPTSPTLESAISPL